MGELAWSFTFTQCSDLPAEPSVKTLPTLPAYIAARGSNFIGFKRR